MLAMTIELAFKIIADGLFFTPNALVRDVGGMLTVFIYFVSSFTLLLNEISFQTSLIFLFIMPKHVEINSVEQFLMICRAMRPLRIYTLVPHIRRVVVELFRGFKEILLVTIFMIVIMFIFGSFGVQSVGGKLAACNDHDITSRVSLLRINFIQFILRSPISISFLGAFWHSCTYRRLPSRLLKRKSLLSNKLDHHSRWLPLVRLHSFLPMKPLPRI